MPALAGSSIDAVAPIVFATPGLKAVTLNVCNGAKCSQITQYIQVLDPTPRIASTTAASTVQLPALLDLQATGSGKPPLTYTWHIQQAFACQIVDIGGDLTGSAVVWNPVAYGPGWYWVTLTLSGPGGAPDIVSFAVQVTLPPNPARILNDGFEDPCPSPPIWLFTAPAPL